ncbi:MAG: acetyl-CoA carboxylase biotin carboxyl carrier protein subunit [Bacilli bacterium]|nr:acetyl-CoA carboxylase biotin carboxyl carrier protein subunit [Bacilli bacterium]
MKIYKIKVNGKSYKVELEAIEEIKSEAPVMEKKEEAKASASATGEGNKVLSPIQGTVINIKVNVGDKVKKGQVVCVVEAMKLENDVVSEFDGEVTQILVSKGSNVASKGALMIVK